MRQDKIDATTARRIRNTARRLRRLAPAGVDPLEGVVAALPVKVSESDFATLLGDPDFGDLRDVLARFGTMLTDGGVASVVLPAGLDRERRREALARNLANAALYGWLRGPRPALPRPRSGDVWLAQTGLFAHELLGATARG